MLGPGSCLQLGEKEALLIHLWPQRVTQQMRDRTDAVSGKMQHLTEACDVQESSAGAL